MFSTDIITEILKYTNHIDGFNLIISSKYNYRTYLNYIKFNIEEISKYNINNMIKNENLIMIKQLHKHKMDCFDPTNMDTAIEYSCYDIFEFLYNNRTEGCTDTGLLHAIIQKDMNLLKMLCETYPQIAIGPSINYAAVSDNFDIFEYLLMSMENVDLERILRCAIMFSKPNIVHYLLDIFPNIDTRNILAFIRRSGKVRSFETAKKYIIQYMLKNNNLLL